MKNEKKNVKHNPKSKDFIKKTELKTKILKKT
jgi:hypothetical protein